MDRSKLLVQKQDEIRQHLRQWNLEHELLETGEFLSFTLNIGRIEDCVIPVIQPDVAAVNRNEWSHDLNNEDWDFLLDCTFKTVAHTQFISLLRDRQNKPIRVREAEEALKVDLCKLVGKNFRVAMSNALRTNASWGKYRYCIGSPGGSGVSVEEKKYLLEKSLKIS